MEDISLTKKEDSLPGKPDSSEMDMSVSPVCEKDGKKYAFVTFSDGERMAEGRIPECTIITSRGFSDEEKQGLEDYMRSQLTTLKKMAAGIDLLRAFMN